MRKKLLSEAQVRRFQSLASIEPLNEMGDKAYKKHHGDDGAMEEAAYNKDDMDEALYEEEDDMAGDDRKMDEADVELDEELVEKFMEAAATIQEVADALGGGAADDMDMDDMDMDADKPADDMDLGGDEPPAPAPEESPEDDEDVLEEALSGISYIPSQKEIVSTVAKRVAKRLQEAKHAQAKLNRALGKRR